MGLMTEELATRLPAMESQRQKESMAEWTVAARFVDPETGFRWYPIEFDGRDRFFGLMAGKHALAGEFTLSELENLGDGENTVRMDAAFQPLTLQELVRHDPVLQGLLPPDSEQLIDLKP